MFDLRLLTEDLCNALERIQRRKVIVGLFFLKNLQQKASTNLHFKQGHTQAGQQI